MMGNKVHFAKWIDYTNNLMYDTSSCVYCTGELHTSLILSRAMTLLVCGGALLKKEKADVLEGETCEATDRNYSPLIVLCHQSSNCLTSFSRGLCWGKKTCEHRVLRAWHVTVGALSGPTIKATRTWVPLHWSLETQNNKNLLVTDALNYVS